MTELVYSEGATMVRGALIDIWHNVHVVDQKRQLFGREPNVHLTAVGELLRAATTDELSPSYLPAYEDMGVKGLLLVAAAVLYDLTQGMFDLSSDRRMLRQRLEASADDVQMLQAGAVGPFLPELQLEG